MMKGWDLLIKQKDGLGAWIKLAYMKESHPVEVAEFAKARGINDEPAFAWWVRDTLRRRDRIISKVKSRYWKRTHKYGVELPKSVEQALAIDRKTGTDLWKKAIEKEMRNVMPAFEFDPGDKIRPGYKKITCHMVFDIKMDGSFTRKVRLVADGHKTGEAPAHTTDSSGEQGVSVTGILACCTEWPEGHVM